MNRPRAHTFRGRRYRVKWRKPRAINENGKKSERLGYCENPKQPNPSMCIDPKLSEHLLLRTAIDESIHACFFDIGNDEVGEASSDIAAFLRRVGFGLAKSEKA